MLTDKEMKWLDHRPDYVNKSGMSRTESDQSCASWRDMVDVSMDTLRYWESAITNRASVFKDAAEFEARVCMAISMLHPYYSNGHVTHKDCDLCPDNADKYTCVFKFTPRMGRKCTDIRSGVWFDLKRARLQVEAEMEMEHADR